jgi:membrane associated rhomboid family serine protease
MTIILIVITSLISILAFNNHNLFSRMQFNAYQIFHRKELYRLITHGFIHANWMHLFMNMFVLYFFGKTSEAYLKELAFSGIIKYPTLIFMVLYFLSMVFSSSISLFKHKDNIWYNAVGASGAVSALLFFSIFFSPWQMIYVYFIPVPGIIFAILYIFYCQYMSRRGGDNIAHEAHLLGAVFGFIFPLFLHLELYKYFIDQLLSFHL